jgi:hypothetical protein
MPVRLGRLRYERVYLRLIDANETVKCLVGGHRRTVNWCQ